jgi:cbb3-type cytochrome oxidase subunit 3
MTELKTLDKEIAHRIMGLNIVEPKPYSINMAYTWEVMEKMRKDGFYFRLSIESYAVAAQFYRPMRRGRDEYEKMPVPETICRAAIKAKERLELLQIP